MRDDIILVQFLLFFRRESGPVEHSRGDSAIPEDILPMYIPTGFPDFQNYIQRRTYRSKELPPTVWPH